MLTRFHASGCVKGASLVSYPGGKANKFVSAADRSVKESES